MSVERQREIEFEIGQLLEEWAKIEHLEAGEPDEPIGMTGWVACLEYNSISMMDEGESARCNVFPKSQSPALTAGILHQGLSNV